MGAMLGGIEAAAALHIAAFGSSDDGLLVLTRLIRPTAC
jgi:hypothetical protein